MTPNTEEQDDWLDKIFDKWRGSMLIALSPSSAKAADDQAKAAITAHEQESKKASYAAGYNDGMATQKTQSELHEQQAVRTVLETLKRATLETTTPEAFVTDSGVAQSIRIHTNALIEHMLAELSLEPLKATQSDPSAGTDRSEIKSLPEASYGIRFTIPDLPPAEQLEMVEKLISSMKAFHKLTGEDNITNLAPLYDARTRLQADIAGIDMTTTSPEATTTDTPSRPVPPEPKEAES